MNYFVYSGFSRKLEWLHVVNNEEISKTSPEFWNRAEIYVFVLAECFHVRVSRNQTNKFGQFVLFSSLLRLISIMTRSKSNVVIECVL